MFGQVLTGEHLRKYVPQFLEELAEATKVAPVIAEVSVPKEPPPQVLHISQVEAPLPPPPTPPAPEAEPTSDSPTVESPAIITAESRSTPPTPPAPPAKRKKKG